MKYIKIFEDFGKSFTKISQQEFEEAYESDNIYIFSDDEIGELESKLPDCNIYVDSSSLYKFSSEGNPSTILVYSRLSGGDEIIPDRIWDEKVPINIYGQDGKAYTVTNNDINNSGVRYTDMIQQRGGYTIENSIIEISIMGRKFYVVKYNNDEWYHVKFISDYWVDRVSSNHQYYKCDQIEGIIDLLSNVL